MSNKLRSIRPLIQVISLACVGLFACMMTAQAKSWSCDPHARVLAQADNLLLQGQFNAAMPIVTSVWATDKNDFHTNFLRGQILFDHADAVDANHWNPPSSFSPQMSEAFTILENTASQLDAINEKCAKERKFFTIFNTIGQDYLNRGYFDKAETFLLLAATKRSLLSSDSYVKVLDNLGLVYLVTKKCDLARRYYDEAERLGSLVAVFQLPKVKACR